MEEVQIVELLDQMRMERNGEPGRCYVKGWEKIEQSSTQLRSRELRETVQKDRSNLMVCTGRQRGVAFLAACSSLLVCV